MGTVLCPSEIDAEGGASDVERAKTGPRGSLHDLSEPCVLYSGPALYQAGLHVLRIRCLGVQKSEVELAEAGAGSYTVSVNRRSSLGIPATKWVRCLKLADETLELMPERMHLSAGVLEVVFERKMRPRRVFRLQEQAECTPVSVFDDALVLC
eukprot:TRINITY_DN38963_c0_g1_i1.p1 TRINITY_DN38963_c0_g1~~TRINITY_DN38963_c0_g1_i1.p1  ORF type:complete len:153 (+),score=23.60 TRINITY_DN38963_c0_g1_i1:2-460(+)